MARTKGKLVLVKLPGFDDLINAGWVIDDETKKLYPPSGVDIEPYSIDVIKGYGGGRTIYATETSEEAKYPIILGHGHVLEKGQGIFCTEVFNIQGESIDLNKQEEQSLDRYGDRTQEFYKFSDGTIETTNKLSLTKEQARALATKLLG
jgi:hypothetical protein